MQFLSMLKNSDVHVQVGLGIQILVRGYTLFTSPEQMQIIVSNSYSIFNSYAKIFVYILKGNYMLKWKGLMTKSASWYDIHSNVLDPNI